MTKILRLMVSSTLASRVVRFGGTDQADYQAQPGHQDQEQEQRSNHKDNDIDKSDADPNADAEAEKDSLFGSDISATQECYICLEEFHERRGEARVVQPCGHLLDVECLVHWFGFLQSDLKVEVRCPVCRGLVRGVDDLAI
jgi:hypothetical protein